MGNFVSVVGAARLKGVSRQAIYQAIRLGKLKAYMNGERYQVSLDDLKRYDDEKYCRNKSTLDGEYIFDYDKGLLSVFQAAQMLGVPRQQLYHAVRTGKLKTVRKNCAYVITTQDLLEYAKVYLIKGCRMKRIA
jgi:excisionase family DNA binding protein